MNIAIVTDTTSGITPQQAAELGVHLIPMPTNIDGQEYLEYINLERDFFQRKQEEGADITTSQPAPGTLTDLWDTLLESHDSIVHLPMASSLSSTYTNAVAIAEDYDGRVKVVDTQRVSVPLYQTVLDALLLREKGLTAEDICKGLEENARNYSIYITPITLEYLKKGGRITPAAAAIGTVLNIKPVLQIQGNGVDAFAKVRGMKQAKEKMFAALDHDLATRFAGKNVRVFAAYSGDEAVGESWKAEMEAHYGAQFYRIDPLALVLCCHTGPGAIGLGCAVCEE